MFQMVNGVRISEVGEAYGGSFEHKVFEMIYEDPKYLNQRIDVNFQRVNVVGIGPMWIYAIKNIPPVNYEMKRELYAAAVANIHSRVFVYLKEKYGFIDQCVLVDHVDRLFKKEQIEREDVS